MAAIVYGWAIQQQTDSGLAAGFVMAASVGALVVGTLFAGRIVARWGVRGVALSGAWVSALSACVIAFLFAAGHADPLPIAAVAALGAILDGPATIAVETNFPTVARLARVRLLSLNAVNESLEHLAALMAPAVGVAIMAVAGTAAGVAAVAGLSLLGATILTAALPPFRTLQTARATRLRTIVDWLSRDRLVCALVVLLSLAVSLLASIQLVILPLALGHRADGAQGLAMFLAMFGVGGLFGALGAGIFKDTIAFRWLLPIVFLCLAIATTFLVASTSVFNLAIGGLLYGACVGFVSPPLATALQQRPPKHLRADIQAISGALIFAGAPVAMLGLGFLSEALRPSDLLSIVAGGFVVLAACAPIAVPGNGHRRDQTTSK
ncbi:MAG: MFS transporter [Alphaproteobacteria bacterium]|nr:MFS transporter [Alphaproteobacteria bacterium]